LIGPLSILYVLVAQFNIFCVGASVNITILSSSIYLSSSLKFNLLFLYSSTFFKSLISVFDNNLYLINKLGLVGGWCYLEHNSDKYDHPKTYKYYLKYGDKEMMEKYIKNSMNHLNFEIVTNNGTLYYYDMLSYGTLKCVDNENELNKKLNKIGPDIMDKNTTFEVFKENIYKKNNLKHKFKIKIFKLIIIIIFNKYIQNYNNKIIFIKN